MEAWSRNKRVRVKDGDGYTRQPDSENDRLKQNLKSGGRSFDTAEHSEAHGRPSGSAVAAAAAGLRLPRAFGGPPLSVGSDDVTGAKPSTGVTSLDEPKERVGSRAVGLFAYQPGQFEDGKAAVRGAPRRPSQRPNKRKKLGDAAPPSAAATEASPSFLPIRFFKSLIGFGNTATAGAMAPLGPATPTGAAGAPEEWLLPPFASLPNLAAASHGARVVFASDECFGVAERLLREESAVSGGVDGWLTRRRRQPGHEWCLVQLAMPGVVRGLEVRTDGMRGCYAPALSIEGAFLPDLEAELTLLSPEGPPLAGSLGTSAPARLIQRVEKHLEAQAALGQWTDLLPMERLKAERDGSTAFFEVESQTVTHLRVNLFPDGGLSRLRVFGEVRRPSPIRPLCGVESRPDLLSLRNGGLPLLWSNAAFAPPIGLTYDCDHDAPGWCTHRKPFRLPVLYAARSGSSAVANQFGEEWVVFRLGHRGEVGRVAVDTTGCKGTVPESCRIEVIDLPEVLSKTALEQRSFLAADAALATPRLSWKPLLPRSPLNCDPTITSFVAPLSASQKGLRAAGTFTHARLTVYPDGAVTRLRLYMR